MYGKYQDDVFFELNMPFISYMYNTQVLMKRETVEGTTPFFSAILFMNYAYPVLYLKAM